MNKRLPLPKIHFSSRTGPELFVVLIGQIAAAAGSFVGVKWLTARLTSSEYGQVGLALTGVTFVQLCVGGPISMAALRYYTIAVEHQCVSIYLHSIRKMLLITGVPIILLAAILAFCIARFGSPHNAELLIVATLLAVLYGIGLNADSVQSGARKRLVVALHQSAVQWLRPICACALFLVVGRSSLVTVAGFVIGTVLVLGSQLIMLDRLTRIRHRDNLNLEDPVQQTLNSSMLRYAVPFLSWGVISWLQTASDRWFLELFRDSRSVAIFTVCYQLGYYPMLMLSMAISGYVTPILYQIAGRGDDAERLYKARRLNLIYVLSLAALSCLVGLLEYLFGNPILRHLATADYVPFSSSLGWMALSAGLFAIAQAITLFFLVAGDSSSLVSVKVGTACLGALFNYVGIRYFGVQGAVISCVLFGLVYCLWTILLLLFKGAGFRVQGEPQAEVPASIAA